MPLTTNYFLSYVRNRIRFGAVAIFASIVLAAFASDSRAGLILGAATACLDANETSAETPSENEPEWRRELERRWCPLAHNAPYTNGGAGASNSPTTSVNSLSGALSYALAAGAEIPAPARAWERLAEREKLPSARGVIESIFHPPRAES